MHFDFVESSPSIDKMSALEKMIQLESHGRTNMQILIIMSFAFACISAFYSYQSFAETSSETVYVSPAGQDLPDSGSESHPYQTISYALGQARPGVTILVREGTYPEYIKTSQDGTPESPITLRAVGQVHLVGDEVHKRIMDLWNDYYVIEGFEWHDKDVLLWMQEADHNSISNNFFHHALGECVRVKYQSTHNTLSENRVEDCGLTDFVHGGSGKNGEGIYIGTAPEQLYKNPTQEVDESSFNTVKENVFNTRGNECVDIKEGSNNTIIEYNDCTGQKDPESGGFSSRGNENMFRYNNSHQNVGAGIRLGGDDTTMGINNDVYVNELTGNSSVAIKVTRLPQRTICGNTVLNNAGGLSNNASIVNPPCSSFTPVPSPSPTNQPSSLRATPDSISIGSATTVTFSTPSGTNNTRDWIGLYRKDETNDRRYLDWKYTNGTQQGNVTFSIRDLGEYEFRYFKNNGYTKLMMSNSVTVSSC